MTASRVLYVSPLDLRSKNGMTQLEHQLLSNLHYLYGQSVDMLPLGTSAATARKWLQGAGLRINVLQGFYPLIARLNTTLWYGGGVVLCDKAPVDRSLSFPAAHSIASALDPTLRTNCLLLPVGAPLTPSGARRKQGDRASGRYHG